MLCVRPEEAMSARLFIFTLDTSVGCPLGPGTTNILVYES